MLTLSIGMIFTSYQRQLNNKIAFQNCYGYFNLLAEVSPLFLWRGNKNTLLFDYILLYY